MEATQAPAVTRELDRHNGNVFIRSYLLLLFTAPVIYVGIVQAALCDKLGASATVANLPGSAYLAGAFAPIVICWLVPHRHERLAAAVAYGVTATVVSLVALCLFLHLPREIIIGAVVFQGLVQGFSSATAFVYTYQCLGRGTTEAGRARALKIGLTGGPAAAVAGSLGAQFVLNHGIRGIEYPYDFGLLYGAAVPCLAAVVWTVRSYSLPPVEEEPRRPFWPYLRQTARSYFGNRSYVILWMAHVLWYSSLSTMTNLSLYIRIAVRREPKELSGLIMALRFGAKAVAGFLLGKTSERWGPRVPAAATISFLGVSMVWAWLTPGYPYLAAFGLMGAGELGGAYLPNYQVAISSPTSGARNLSLLGLGTLCASLAQTVHGRLADLYGFPASFLFGFILAAAGLALMLQLPARPEKPDF